MFAGTCNYSDFISFFLNVLNVLENKLNFQKLLVYYTFYRKTFIFQHLNVLSYCFPIGTERLEADTNGDATSLFKLFVELIPIRFQLNGMQIL